MEADERFRRAAEQVLEHEGGLVESPGDPGGITKYGVSLRSYPELGRDGIANLTREQAIEIYRRDWWERYGIDRLPDPVAGKILDLAVNMGPAPAFRLLQQALVSCGERVAVDGVLGPQTCAAAHRVVERGQSERLMTEVRAAAAYRYAEMALSDPARWRYLRGWIRRAVS